jgi:hypothetical protein
MINIKYKSPGKTIDSYIRSDAFIVGIRGPIGSGKSVASVIKLIHNFSLQQRSPDGWQRRRSLIVRNTYPELKTTTMKTFYAWMPKGFIGDAGYSRETGPPTHHYIDNVNKQDWEIIFLAIDSPDDVKKVLSLEISDCWINEAREIQKPVVDAISGRLGRYPRREGNIGCMNAQLIMDTNSPETEHWWYTIAERDVSTEKKRQMIESLDTLEISLRDVDDRMPEGTPPVLKKEQKLFEFFSQPGGLSNNAENIDNLPHGYYQKCMAGKDQQWINVYVHGMYGFVMDGRPVYPEYRDDVHSRELKPTPHLPLYIGCDWGLTPAAICGQIMPNGQWRILSEFVTEDMGIVRFGENLKQHIQQKYPNYEIASFVGDPSGSIRGFDERTVFDIMKSVGLDVKPAPGKNDPIIRRESLIKLMTRLIDGEPGLLVNKSCNHLRKGLSGGFKYSRVRVVGDERFREMPDKNTYSHICEAAEYMILGGGGSAGVLTYKKTVQKPVLTLGNRW